MKQSKYKEQKQQALESFVDFAEGGGELPRWPLEMFLEISNICDLKCAMCPTFSAINPDRFFNLKKADRGVIAIENATQPLTELLEHALVVHAFGYGEPTIHPQFREVLEFLSDYEVLIDFFTNGMHLDDSLCDFLVEKKISRITVSFSGSTAEDYENIYLGGDFERVLQGLRNLDAAKKRANSDYPAIEINSIAFNHHIHKLPDFVEIMADVGADVIHVKPLSLYPGTQPLKNHSSWMNPEIEGEFVEKAKVIAKAKGIVLASMPYERTQYKAKPIIEAMEAMPEEERIKIIETRAKETIPVGDIKNLSLSDEMVQANRDNLKKKKDHLKKEKLQLMVEDENYFSHKGVPCFEPLKTFYASFDGSVFPCCFKGTKHWIGNLNEQSAADIWTNEYFSTLKEGVLNGFYPKELCEGCVRKGSYPSHHSIPEKSRKYVKWFGDVFAGDFSESLLARADVMPDNTAILSQYKVK